MRLNQVINPMNNLANSTQYFGTFASGSVRDLSGNNYTGASTYNRDYG
jgi:hypothetical protein